MLRKILICAFVLMLMLLLCADISLAALDKGYSLYEFSTRKDTTFYEIHVPNGKKIKSITIE